MGPRNPTFSLGFGLTNKLTAKRFSVVKKHYYKFIQKFIVKIWSYFHYLHFQRKLQSGLVLTSFGCILLHLLNLTIQETLTPMHAITPINIFRIERTVEYFEQNILNLRLKYITT